MNKSKHFANIAALAVAIVLTGSVTSCGGDDDDDASSFPASTITDTSGNTLQVNSVSSSDGRCLCRFTYDEKGKIMSASDENEHMTFTMQDGKFVYDAEGDKWRNTHWEILLNSDGLIKEIKITWNYERIIHEHDYDYEEIVFTYTYSGRRLTSFKCSGKETKDGLEIGSGSYQGNLIWKDGNLIQSKIEAYGKETEDGNSHSSKVTYDCTISYGSQRNSWKQMPHNFCDDMLGDMDELTCFSVIGLFGYGPDFLPTSYTYTHVQEIDGETTYAYTDNHNYSFTLNSNGSINTEGVLVYTYGNASSRADSPATQSIGQQVGNMRSIMFWHRRK